MTETAPSVEERKSSAAQPGDLTAKLMECRAKAGLDIDQAAEELHLSVHILQALEKEDFSHLPEPPYVRGYLRGYAKLADMDARELIRTYEALRGADPDEIAHHFSPARPLSKVAQPAISSSTLKFIGFGALVLLLGLLSMIPGVRGWATHTWSSFSAQTNPPDVPRPPSAMDAYVAQKAAQEKEKELAEQQQAKQAAEQQARQAAAQQAQTATQTATASGASSVQDTPATQNPAASASTATVPEVTQATTAQTTPAGTAASSGSTTATTPADAATTAASGMAGMAGMTATTPATDQSLAGTPATTTADGTATQLAPGEMNIKMEFAEDVWLQIKGGDNQSLFESLNTAGSIKEFKATPPLNFKVGNAPGVKIFINGQPFDQAPFIKGSVARFKVE